MRTPLLRITLVDMVKDIIVSDALHLLHLGLLKTLLGLYKDGSPQSDCKWSKTDTSQMSAMLESIKLPTEIHRTVRPIDLYLCHWKGSECATFLNYFGIVVMKDFLPESHYCNFVVLVCATTICSTDYFKRYLSVAKELFKYSAEHFLTMFRSATSNLHNLVHIVDEVERFGHLGTIPAYPFENQLYTR